MNTMPQNAPGAAGAAGGTEPPPIPPAAQEQPQAAQDDPISAPAGKTVDLANFRPLCVVDGKPVPDSRLRTKHGRETCSPECHQTLRQYRAYVVANTRCAVCYRPASLEERADFLAWRKARGTKRGAGRPAIRREENLRQALEAATKLLEKYRNQAKSAIRNAEPAGAGKITKVIIADVENEVEHLDSEILRFKDLAIPPSIEPA